MSMPKPSQFINPAIGLDDEQAVIDVINMSTGDAFCSYQLLLLDANLKPVYLPDPPNPAVRNDLMPFVMECTTDSNADNEVARTITVKFEETAGLQINVLQHRLQLREVRYIPYRGKLVEAINLPRGTFRLTMSKRIFQGDLPPTLDGTYQDLSGDIAGKEFWNDWVTIAGQKATDILSTLMLMDPVPLSEGGSGQTPAGCSHVGIGWNPTLMSITPSDVILPDPITWDWKTNTQLAALSQVCQAINYYKPYNAYDGTEIFRPNPFQYMDADGSMILPVPDWIYRYGRDSIYDGTVDISYPNMAQIFSGIRMLSESNSREDTLESVRWNKSPDSLTSTVNYGWYLHSIEDDMIPDQATANGRALIELQNVCMPEQQIRFTAHPDPFVDIHSTIGAEYLAPDGTPYLFVDQNPFEIKQIRLDVMNRQEEITGLRVISLGPVS